MLAADAVELGGEEHLICDIYKKDGRSQEWIMRAVYTRHDWGLWRPHMGKDGWSRKSIQDGTYKPVPAYDECERISGPGIPAHAGWGNTSLDEESEKIIKDFCKSMHAQHSQYIKQGEWFKYLLAIEKEIRNEKKEKEEERRREAIDDRIRNMPPIPDDFGEWADLQLFHRAEYVYYRRKYSHAECTCSKCGESYTIRTRRPNTFEGMLMHVDPVPVNGEVTVCDLCGTAATYKPEGRMKFVHGERAYAYILQPFKETGTVIRYFEVRKEWCKGAPSDVRTLETGRVFYDIGRKIQTDWYLHNWYTGRNEWYDRKTHNAYNVSMQPGAVYTRNCKEWTTRRLKYSGLGEYVLALHERMKPEYYVSFAQDYHLEKLVKLGMVNTVKCLIGGGEGYFHKTPGGKVEKILRIRRCRLAMAAREDNMDLLKVLQFEKINTEQAEKGRAKGRGEWTEEQIEKAWAMRLTWRGHKVLLEYMSITQLINRVERYLGRPVVKGSEEDVQAKELADYYRDYFKVRIEHDMDMERSTSIFPKSLRAAHNEAVRLINARENEKRAAEYEEKYPEVKKRFRKLKAKYGYKEGDFFIRPAKNIQEIIEEGKILHHCVGASDTYIGRHARGDSFILFLRKTLEPNDPYITIEVSGTEIRQWYGRNDTKPDREVVEKWLEGWLNYLRRDQAVTVTAGTDEALTAAG